MERKIAQKPNKFNVGEIAKIKKISFIGNKIFRDNTLRNVIISEESKFWKFLTRKKFLVLVFLEI